VFAYIPARGGSRRIPTKNIRTLGDRPVIVHVIEALQALDWITTVYVSTDDVRIQEVAEGVGAQCLGLRAPELSNDRAGFAELIHHDIPRFASHAADREVLFALATAALVPPSIYADAHRHFVASKPDILMSCETAHPFWAMTQKPDGFWWPLFPDKVLTNSQNLPKSLVDAGLFYMFDISNMQRFQSVKLADRVQSYEVPCAYTVDVDTLEDWDLLEYKYRKLKSGSR
jgi:CMP-N,N'-diacetyllegionaminic acid synthase